MLARRPWRREKEEKGGRGEGRRELIVSFGQLARASIVCIQRSCTHSDEILKSPFPHVLLESERKEGERREGGRWESRSARAGARKLALLLVSLLVSAVTLTLGSKPSMVY